MVFSRLVRSSAFKTWFQEAVEVGCSKKVLAVLLAWLCVLGVSADARGLVLCFGTDGHVEIEAAHADSCTDPCVSGDVPVPKPDEGCARQDEHHCGTCIDIPLGYPAAAIDRPAASVAAPCQAAPAANATHPLPTTDDSRHAGATAVAPGPLLLLRVTILLI
jgi:hypothetical protein